METILRRKSPISRAIPHGRAQVIHRRTSFVPTGRRVKLDKNGRTTLDSGRRSATIAVTLAGPAEAICGGQTGDTPSGSAPTGSALITFSGTRHAKEFSIHSLVLAGYGLEARVMNRAEVEHRIRRQIERAHNVHQDGTCITYLIRDPRRPDLRGNKLGWPVYVGQTDEFGRRVRNHLRK